jgi:hypothetical protein
MIDEQESTMRLIISHVGIASSATAHFRTGGECEVFPAASAVSVRAGRPFGDGEAKIQIDNGKAGVK